VAPNIQARAPSPRELCAQATEGSREHAVPAPLPRRRCRESALCPRCRLRRARCRRAQPQRPFEFERIIGDGVTRAMNYRNTIMRSSSAQLSVIMMEACEGGCRTQAWSRYFRALPPSGACGGALRHSNLNDSVPTGIAAATASPCEAFGQQKLTRSAGGATPCDPAGGATVPLLSAADDTGHFRDLTEVSSHGFAEPESRLISGASEPLREREMSLRGGRAARLLRPPGCRQKKRRSGSNELRPGRAGKLAHVPALSARRRSSPKMVCRLAQLFHTVVLERLVGGGPEVCKLEFERKVAYLPTFCSLPQSVAGTLSGSVCN